MHCLGIDIHKAFCQTTVATKTGQVVERAKGLSDPEHLRDSFSKFAGSKAAIKSNTVWEFVHDELTRAGIDVTLAHPARVRAIASARVKTDKIDADTLAHLLREDFVPPAYAGTPDLREFRQDVRMRRQIREITSSLKHQISAEMMRKGVQEKTSALRSVRGRARVAKKLPSVRVHRRLMILALIADELDKYNRDVLLPEFEADPKAQRLAQVPGVGNYTAITVVAELGDVDRFADNDSVVSYAGLALSVLQHHATAGARDQGRIRPTTMGAG